MVNAQEAERTRHVVVAERARLWWDIARDETRRDRDRLEASRLLADRGWGKAPAYVPIDEDNPLGLEDVKAAAEEFRAAILRLAPSEPDTG